jgi:predicted alpha/beta-fold hydrolase
MPEGDIVAIVPGVIGDGTKIYIIVTVNAAWEKWFQPVVANYRG